MMKQQQNSVALAFAVNGKTYYQRCKSPLENIV